MPHTDFLGTTDLLNFGSNDKGKAIKHGSLLASMGRNCKSITFASVDPRTMQPSVICIYDDSECEEIVAKRVRQDRITYVFNETCFKVKTEPMFSASSMMWAVKTLVGG